MVIDSHVHILNAEREHLERLLSFAERAGVDKLCISSLSRNWIEFPGPEHLEEAASDIRQACEMFPVRFIGGVYLSADHVDLSMRLLEENVAVGRRFVKLWVSQYADDPRLDPIYEGCADLDVPVLAHAWIKATGNMARESTCYNVINAARKHPRLKIWLAHASGRWEETGRIIRDYPNVGLDISGGEPEDGIVDCLCHDLSPDRIFFGSDAPGRSFTVQMTKVLSARISEHDKQLILGGNIRRWLHV